MTKSGISVVLLISLVQISMSLSDDNRALIQTAFTNAGQKCVTLHPITAEDISSFKDRQFPEGKDAACFSACVLTDIGLMDENGTLLPTAFEKVKELFKEEEEINAVEEFFQLCAKDLNNEGEDGCDRAKTLFKCFIKNLEKFGF